MEWRPLGIIMIFPTVTLAVYLTMISRKKLSEFLPQLAVVFWISANSLWMIEEFYDLHFKPASLALFVAGMVVMSWWLIRYFRAEWLAAGKAGEEESAEARVPEMERLES